LFVFFFKYFWFEKCTTYSQFVLPIFVSIPCLFHYFCCWSESCLGCLIYISCLFLAFYSLFVFQQIGFDSFESAKRPFCGSWGYRHSQKNLYSSVDVRIQLGFSMLECVNKCARLLSKCNGLDIPRLLLGPCYPYLFQSLVCFIIFVVDLNLV
jgi:hypothetical protein